MINNPVFFKELGNKLDNYRCNIQNCGIVVGDAGMILSLSELYTYTRNEYYLDKMYKILDVILDGDRYDFSLGYGIAGLAWCISLIDEDLINNKHEWLMDIQQALEKEYKFILEQDNLDYFRGATGFLFYFLNSPVQSDNINEIIDLYLQVIQSKLLKNDWFELKYDNSGHFYRALNLGTPHGLTGIILMLLIIREKGFDVDENFLSSMFEVILSYGFKDDEKTGCYFPSRVYEDGKRSKSGLAWCYGDLMIAYAMMKYGITYKNDSFIQHSKIILKDLLSRKNMHPEKLILCHGYPSLSLIYNMIYKKTGNTVYDDVSKQFEQKFNRTFFESYIEYKKNNVRNYFFDESSLLFGYSGFILSSLFWAGHKDCDWLKCLLL